MKAQVTDAVLEWEYLCLSVQCQIQRVQIFLDHFQTVSQILLAWMDQIEVIHIATIVFNPQLVLYQLVHAVQIEQRKALIDLVPKGNALAFRAVNEQIAQPADVRIVAEVIIHNVLQLIVGDVIEKLRYIAFEDVTMESVFAVELPHLLTQSVQAKQSAFSFLSCAVIQNEHALQTRHDHIVERLCCMTLSLKEVVCITRSFGS